MKIVAIILTYNEQLHIARCYASIKNLVTQVVVVDSFSTDATVEIAQSLGARVIQHAWINYARQFNWALTQLDVDTDWVLRIDADEVLTTDLFSEIKASLPVAPLNIDGFYCGRRIAFQGCLIRHGGVFPIRVLRLFRFGRGQCEMRWMDEHIKVDGPTFDLQGEIIDDNLQNLTWWIDKHNVYANREAIDLLNIEYEFMPRDSVACLRGGQQPGVKRWLKERVYARLPLGYRAFAYFSYRYFFCLGFMDGQSGSAFHFLQGLWYRYLVDAKVAEVKRLMIKQGCDAVVAIEQTFGIKISSSNQ